jgi:pimeloyl-ACP methyl ester carboxylesterase
VEVLEVATGTADVVLEYDVVGSGDPVVMVHARPFASWYGPLVSHLPDWSVLRYRRIVRTAGGDFGIGDDAEAVAGLLHHVGILRPHVVGHSYGGIVALALATRDESTVGSLALLEPASLGFLPPGDAEAAVAPLIATYRAEGPEAAMDRFLALVCGDDYRTVLERAVPGAFDDAVATAVQFFEVELPAVVRWTCDSPAVEALSQPVLNMLGSESAVRFGQGTDLIQQWLPHAVRATIPQTNHLLIADRPQAVAEHLDTFWRQF